MSTITKDQAKDLHNAFQCWQQDYDPVEDKEQYDMFGLGIVAMDALLASLEAEPIYQLWDEGYYDTEKETYDAVLKAGGRGRIVYTAPPAQVSVPDEIDKWQAIDDIRDHDESFRWDSADGYEAGWNSCRAAMLQGAEPVTTDYKLPEIAVDNGNPDDDYDQGYVRGWNECRAAMLQSFGNSEQLDSPVIPDGWQLVPKQITLEMECALSRADSYEIGWRWALAAAPQQEVKP